MPCEGAWTMNRTAWLQDRRMVKFGDVLSRWERKQLSAMEAGEILGCSERQFRRYRARYEEEGLQGLFDRRLGKASARRVPIDKVTWMLGEYRTHYRGWNVKHFHEHLQKQHSFRWSYTWVKTQLHTAGLVERNKKRGIHRRKRPRKPCVGMMLHQDASRFAWLEEAPELDLIVTLDDAPARSTRRFWSRRKVRLRASGRCSMCSPRTACPRASTPTAAAITFSPRLPVGRSTSSSGRRWGGRWRTFTSSTSPPTRRKHAGGASACSARSRGGCRRNCVCAASAMSRRPTATSGRFICRCITSGSPSRHKSRGARSCRRAIPQAFPTFCASSRAGWSRATTRCPTRDARCSSRKARCAPTTSRPTSRCASIRTARSRYSTVRDGWRATAPRERNSLTSRPSPA